MPAGLLEEVVHGTKLLGVLDGKVSRDGIRTGKREDVMEITSGSSQEFWMNLDFFFSMDVFSLTEHLLFENHGRRSCLVLRLARVK